MFDLILKKEKKYCILTLCKIEVMYLKEAFVGVGIIIFFTLGFLLMNLFGNITVTDQLNYTTMKNSVQAAMFDATDLAQYRSGFCLCTMQDNFVFDNSSQYEIRSLVKNSCDPETIGYSKNGHCKLQVGEYRITKEIFAESFARRFAEMVNNGKNYRLHIEKVIEYPPKVSVTIESDDKYGLGYGNDGFEIVNVIDGILEEIDVK